MYVCMCLPIRNYEDHYVFTHQRCEDHRSCEDRYLVPVNIIVLIGLNRQKTLRRTTFAVVLITQARAGGTLGIFGWGCAAGTLEPLTYTRASSAEFCYPILE